MKCVLTCEIDEYARKTYLHNYTMINVDKEIETKKIIHKKNIKNVNINNLLNRVKINQKK